MSVVTQEIQDQVSELYIAFFNRAPDAAGFGFWANALASGVSVYTIASEFAKTPEAVSTYGGLTPEQQVNRIYLNVLNRAADPDGLAYWTEQIENGASFSDFAYNFVNAVFIGGTGIATSDTGLVQNKVTVSQYFAVELASNDSTIGATAFTGLTDDPATVTAKEAELDAAVNAGTTYTLTTGADNLVGNDSNNIFEARVVQNPLGEQVNQLASGDRINGGGGIDSLIAKVQGASIAEGGAQGRINPETKNVEIVHLEAVPNSALGTDTVRLDAGDMLGLTEIGSVESDASLIIYDLTTLTNSGLYADRRDESSVTIRMDHTGNGGVVDNASNLEVYFDQNYISPGSINASQGFWWLIDQDADEEGQQPLENINVNGIRGTFGGVAFALQSDLIGGADAQATTWEEAVAALQPDLQAKIAEGFFPEGTTLTLDYDNVRFTFLDNGQRSEPIPAITLTVPDSPQLVVATGFTQIEEPVGDYNVFGRVGSDQGQSVTPTEANIVLNKVGRGSDGGELVVGGMSNDSGNVFNAGSGSKGIQKFNVLVEGDSTQPSDLSSLRSTHNTLEQVIVRGTTGASLTIGNTNTTGAVPNGAALPAVGDNSTGVTTTLNNALKDVRLFDASELTSSVTVHGYLSNEVVDKYLDLEDDQIDSAFDNVNFLYTLTGGNDTLNMNLSKANLAFEGTATREDFTFTADGGAGNDTILLQIGDSTGAVSDNWFNNTVQNQNLTINAGDGDDTVVTYGAGAFLIRAGAGDDVVITDNSGVQVRTLVNETSTGIEDAVFGNAFNEGKATYVFNVGTATGDRNIDDLRSSARSVTQTDVAQTTVSVNFMGVVATAVVGGTNAVSGGTVNDLTIRQAIKEAINKDPYLKNLLLAEDGPSGALVVTALTDGARTLGDLTIGLESALNTAQAALPAAAQPTALAAGDITAYLAAGRFGTQFAQQEDGADGGQTDAGVLGDLIGKNSVTDANVNTVLDGSGVDTIVLSTATGAPEAVILANDDVVDLIVNFSIDDSVRMEDNAQIFSVLNANGATELRVGSAEGTVEGLLTNEDGTLVQVAGTFVLQADALGLPTDIDGSALADNITGNEVANIIRGGAGNDTLTGGAAADSLTGGLGADQFNVDAGADEITDFGVGADRVTISAGATLAAAVTADYTAAAAGDIDNQAGVADAVFTVANDIDFDASAATGTTSGITITAAGNAAASTLIGTDQGDVITGGLGGDTLDGDAGDDTITGGAGADSLTGGAGADTFVYGNGTVTTLLVADGDGDGVNAEITVDVGAGTYSVGNQITISGVATADVVYTVTADDVADADVFAQNLGDAVVAAAGDFLDGTVAVEAGVATVTAATDAITTLTVASAVTLGDTGVTVATADVITDFATADDSISVGVVGGAETVTIADGGELADFTDFVTAANNALGEDVRVYVAYDAVGSGNAYAAVDRNGNGTFEAGDTLIVLNGVDLVTEIVATNFIA